MVLPQLSQAADWKDTLKEVEQRVKDNKGKHNGRAYSNNEIAKGLKQALHQSIIRSVKQLGSKNGFLGDSTVKIPMPKSLKKIDKFLRKIGKAKVADEFIRTMNHAAEKAVSKTVVILVEAMKGLTLTGAVKILNGGQNAATDYFRRSSTESLRKQIKPVIHRVTDSVGLTARYKKLMKKSGSLSRYIDKDSLDIDSYITNKAIDGLFVKIALEEKRIRNNPAARTTKLLKGIFKKH